MILRKKQSIILNSLKSFPVVGLLGSRQVGKTTLSKEIQRIYKQNTIYIDLELPSDLNKLREPELYLSQYKNNLVIIDEIQRMPSLFPLLRAMVDQNRVPGRYLILGSASLDLIKKSSESLAGRIIYHELSPFNIFEIGLKKNNMNMLWLKGGYPDSFLSEIKSSFTWREAFIKTYLERDIPQLGIRVPALQLRKFWTMMAHVHGQLWNANQISRSLAVSAPTVNHYLDILEQTFLVRKLQPYFANVKKRLIKSPKIYLRDSGILHALLNNRTLDDLYSYPQMGSSWEGFVIEQIISLTPHTWGTYFYRTNAGAEIDLLLIRPNKNPLAIGIRYSSGPALTRGFWNAFEDLKCDKGYVVYPGKESYPISKNVITLPVLQLEKILE